LRAANIPLDSGGRIKFPQNRFTRSAPRENLSPSTAVTQIADDDIHDG
jgi:hypothetical protein